MNDTSLTPSALDEILAGVHEELESGADAARIRKIAEAHPDARDEIFAFVAEWFASDGSDLSDDEPVTGRTAREHHALLDRFWQAAGADDDDPFDNTSAERIDVIAIRCRINRDILRQVVRRKVDEMSVPGRLVCSLASELAVAPQAVWATLSATNAVAHVDFFAPDGRKPGGKVRFVDVIRRSDLGPADKRFWLDRLEE